jgi:hypothetical protein
VGPLPSSQGHTHILTIIDRTTRWAEAAPLISTTATSCAQALCTHWITRFGLPHTITSDRGAQFTSQIWSNLTTLLNIHHIHTTSFHPQSNGLVERFHRRLKTTLRARCSSPDWMAHLPWFLLSFRATPHDLSNCSPAEAVFGTPLILPSQFPASPEDSSSHFLTTLDHTLSGTLTSTPSTTEPPPPPIPKDLLSSPMVFVLSPPTHPPLSPSYSGPFKVLKRSPHSFLLQIGSSTDSVSVQRLKPANLSPGTPPATPPPRGRPPKSILRPPKIPSQQPHKSVTFLSPPVSSSRPHRSTCIPSRFNNFLL